MLCTLSVDNDHYFVTGLVFKKKFELLHSSMNSNICFTGYNFNIVERYNTSTKGDDESDQEVPLLIPLDSNSDGYKNNEATHGANKLTLSRPVDAPSSIPKAVPTQEPAAAGSMVQIKCTNAWLQRIFYFIYCLLPNLVVELMGFDVIVKHV